MTRTLSRSFLTIFTSCLDVCFYCSLYLVHDMCVRVTLVVCLTQKVFVKQVVKEKAVVYTSVVLTRVVSRCVT